VKLLALAAAIVAVTGAVATGHAQEATTEVRASIARVLDRDASPWAATARDPNPMDGLTIQDVAGHEQSLSGASGWAQRATFRRDTAMTFSEMSDRDCERVV
jgi:hypothetical protein